MTPRVYRSALLLKRRNAFVVSQVGWAHTAFEERQHAINRQREQRRGNRAGQDQSRVGECEPFDDWLAEPACPDERRERRGTNGYHRGSSHPGHDHRCGERQPDPSQLLC